MSEITYPLQVTRKTAYDIVYDPMDSKAMYVYAEPPEGCLYRSEGKPSCIVGQILYRIAPDYIPQEGRNAFSMTSDLRGLGLSLEAVRYLQLLQELQDCGMAWGRVLSLADNFFRYLTPGRRTGEEPDGDQG